MSTINIHNYESFFLDYSEQALTESETKDLLEFLNNNPNLKSEFELFTSNEQFTFVSENITFESKEKLHNIAELSMFDVTETEFLCIGAHEGDLTNEQELRLEQILTRDAAGRKLYEQIKQARIKPDTKIKFPKHRIKRTTTLRIKPLIAYAAAASVMLFFGIRFSNSSDTSVNDISQQQLAHTVLNVNFTKPEKISNNNTSKFEKQNSDIVTKSDSTIEIVTEIVSEQNLYAYEPSESMPIAVTELSGATETFVKVSTQKNETKVGYAEVLQKRFDEMQNPATLWAIAETGVSVLGKMTDSDIRMKNSYTEKGKLQELNLSGENFKLRRTFNSSKQ